MAPDRIADRQRTARCRFATKFRFLSRSSPGRERRLYLVGHSYGAAVALIAALARRDQISALALYEPTLFALVDAESPPPNDADGIRAVISKATAWIEAGEPTAAAECFIDYWMGSGTWAQMPEWRKALVTSGIANMRSWASALLEKPTPLKSFAALSVPVLFMIGKHSPPSSLAVAKLLVKALPRLEVIEFEELGHMGPVTHPAVVNGAIAGFIGRNGVAAAL